ncbi:MAG: rhodanese-like domain-containing protein [Verrucomicrobiota bacterium]
MKTIEPAELAKLLADQPALPLLDVRTPVEFAEVHVLQAVNIPLDQLNPQALLDGNRVNKEKPVYLICRSGQRATKAAELFERAGFSEPTVVTGGTLAWDAANLPVVRGTSKVISLERQVRIAAGALVFSGVLLSKLVHPAFIWLSGFVGAGLIFAGITDFCGMGLLLAKAPWNKRVSS